MVVHRAIVALFFAALAGGLAAQAWAAQPGDDPDTAFRGALIADSQRNLSEFFPAERRIAVPLFRLAFVINNAGMSEVGAGRLPGRSTTSSQSMLSVHLSGVDVQTMQRITDNAYETLLGRLREAGREVVPASQLQRHWAGFKPVPTSPGRPYVWSHRGRTAMFFAPTGMPLVLTHFEKAWGDEQVQDESNYRQLLDVAADTNAAVIAPVALLEFARIRAAGFDSGQYVHDATTTAQMGMTVAALGSVFVRPGRVEGAFQLTSPVTSPEPFGSMHVTSRQVDGSYDLPSAAAAYSTAAGATRRSSTYATARTTNADYFRAANDAFYRMATLLGKWFAKYGAGSGIRSGAVPAPAVAAAAAATIAPASAVTMPPPAGRATAESPPDSLYLRLTTRLGGT
jgi:hypothetical protein